MLSSIWRENVEVLEEMFVTTPEIVWHNKEPIFSVDLHHSRGTLRIATAGADHTVKVSFPKINIGIYIYIIIYIYSL